MIDFPANPTNGQQFTVGNTTWVWDGTKWTTVSGVAPVVTEYLPLVGGTLTGPLILAADPTIPLGASTKEYVDVNTGAVLLSATPPLDAKVGALWWDTVGGNLYVWFDDGTSQQWVAASNGFMSLPGWLPLGGGTLTGTLNAVDANFSGPVTINGAAFDGVPFTISITGAPGNTNFPTIDAPLNSWRSIMGTTSGVDRWHLSLGNGTEEAGANAGCDFALYSYDDTGAYLDAPLQINRQTSEATFSGYVTCASGLFYTQQPTSEDNCHYWFLDYTGASKGILYWEHSADSMILSHSDSGQSISIDSGGNCWLPLDVHAGYGYACRQGMTGGYGANRFNFFYNSDGTVQGWIDATYMGYISFVSDYRIKKSITPLPSMWERVKALKPIRYSHKDYTPQSPAPTKDGSSPPPLVKADNIERWGFVAHELQETLVESAASGVKDQADTIQSPNPWTVIASLTKALQEAMTRIEALEAARA